MTGSGSRLALDAHVASAESAPGHLIGWKAGLGGPGAIDTLHLQGALVGRLVAEGQLSSGTTVSVADWVNPRLEPEIAVRIGRRLTGDETPESVIDAIAEAMPAFELVDVTGTLDDVPAILRTNIYHRAIVLGAPLDPLEALQGALPVTIIAGARTVAHRKRATDAIGGIATVIAHAARAVAAAGEAIESGQLVMTGSLVTPIPVVAGQDYLADLGRLGVVSLRTS